MDEIEDDLRGMLKDAVARNKQLSEQNIRLRQDIRLARQEILEYLKMIYAAVRRSQK